MRIYGKYLIVLKELYKWLKLGNIFSYCQKCGRRVHDFKIPNKIWMKVTEDKTKIYCYDCFCEIADKKIIKFRL